MKTYTEENVQGIVNAAVKATTRMYFGDFFDHSNAGQWHAKINTMLESENAETRQLGSILRAAYNMCSVNGLLTAEEEEEAGACANANG